MNDYYTYMLACSNGVPFYDGKGRGNRIYQHEEEAKRGCECQKCEVIRQIWASGGQVMRVKVLENLSEQEALFFESYFIYRHRNPYSEGVCHLANRQIPRVSKQQIKGMQQELRKTLPKGAILAVSFLEISQEAQAALDRNGVVYADNEVYFPGDVQILFNQDESGLMYRRFIVGEDRFICLPDPHVLNFEVPV